MANIKEYQGHKEWVVARDFATEGHGPWLPGAKVQLLFEDAAWINRSSPGNPDSNDPIMQSPVLVTEAEYAKLYAKKGGGKQPAQNRQVTKSQNRDES